MEVLSIDPGTAKLGFVHVEWNGKEAPCEANYALRWACVVNLSAKIERRDDDEENQGKEQKGGEHLRYEDASNQLENLKSFLSNNRTLKAIVSEKNRKERTFGDSLRVIIEWTEGVRDLNVLTRLMRVNMVSGYLYGYFRSKGLDVSFVPKNFKFGWTSIGSIVKKKMVATTAMTKVASFDHRASARPSPSAKRGTGINKAATRDSKKGKRANAETGRNLRKKSVCHLARYVTDVGFSCESVKLEMTSCKSYEKMNHFSDAFVQAIKYVITTTPDGSRRTMDETKKKAKRGAPSKGMLNGTLLSKEAIDYIEKSLR